MAVAFTYCGLELSQTQIRLLHVSESTTEGSSEDTINCRLVRVDFDACPPYRALSYTWASLPSAVSRPLDPKTILINGASLGIGDNLWEFLRLVSRRKLPFANKPIWVDQVCIDQENGLGKNQQVAHMGLLFAKAEQVLAWLGPEADGSHGAIQYLVDLCTRFWKLEPPSHKEVSGLDTKYLQRLYDGMPAHSANLIKLLRRPYWMRLWVLQEVQLASDLLVVCGSAWLPRRVFQLCLSLLFQELSFAAMILSQVGATKAMSWGYLHPIPDFKVLYTTVIKTLHHIDDVKIPLSKFSWAKLLVEGAELKCRESVDYVYGLLALLNEANQIRVDYSIESGELFWKVFMNFTSNTADLDTKAAILRLGRKMNVTGREMVCKKGIGSAERARFRSIFGKHPEEIFQSQSDPDELIDMAAPDRSLPILEEDSEIRGLLGLVDGRAVDPELNIENQPFNGFSSRLYGEYITSNWLRTWYAGT